jgi:hypothetical protein
MAVASAAGRMAVYVALQPDETTATGLWIPRLRLAARGEHPLPNNLTFSEGRSDNAKGYVIKGSPRTVRPDGDVCVMRVGNSFAE